MISSVSKFLFKTPIFKRAVVEGSAQGNEESGCPGTIDFEKEPLRDKDRGSKLEEWLGKKSLDDGTPVILSSGEDATRYRMFDGGHMYSIDAYMETKRDNHSAVDPLEYWRVARIRVQPPIGRLTGLLREALENFGYKHVRAKA